MRKTSKRDARYVQHASRNDKAHRIGNGVRADGKLGAMGVTVKDCERAHQNCSNPQRWLGRKRNHPAKRDSRQGDADFNARQRYAKHAERSRHRHHEREHDREQPDRRHSKKGAP